VATEYANKRDAPNARKVQLDSVLDTEEVDVARFQTATKELETNSFVQLMAAANAVRIPDATNLLLGALTYAQAMVADADAQ